jgi:nitrite reductase (NADH) large subunit
MAPERLLVVGNGMASVRLVETLLARGPGRFAITVVGEEPQPAYNRVLLSALLAGDVAQDDIALRSAAWYGERGVTLLTGDRVDSLDLASREAVTAGGRRLAYGQLVLATGSEAVRLPLPGADLPGVMTFRDLGDVALLDAAAKVGLRVAVVGGGLLGIEAACGLARRGADVTLVHVMDRLMERQLDVPAAASLRRAVERRGVKVRLGMASVAVTGETAATGLAFGDGTALAADLVVFAVGIRPRAGLARAAGLAVNRGIVVDDHMQASASGIHAIGECAEHRGVVYGLVEPAYAQAAVLADRLCGGSARFGGMVPATNLKVSGVPVFSAGDFMGGPGTVSATLHDNSAGVYRKLVFEGRRLAGCVLVGEADDALWYLELIRERRDISAIRRDLIHGREFADCLPATAA